MGHETPGTPEQLQTRRVRAIALLQSGKTYQSIAATLNASISSVVRWAQVHLLRHLRGPVVLLWDGGTIHTRVIVQDFLRAHTRLHGHWNAAAPFYPPHSRVPAVAVVLHPRVRSAVATPLEISILYARVDNTWLYSCSFT